MDIVDNPLTSKKEQGNVKIEQNKELVNAPIKKKTIMNKKNKIFISYSHADSAYFNRLITHLKVLKNYNGEFEEWSDQKILAGQKWKEEITKALKKANIAILLVSTDFLASDFIQRNELPPILKKAAEEDTTILCLLVEPSLFEKTELGDFQAINDPRTTLSELDKSAQERMYLKLVEEIERITSSCN